MMLAAVLKGLLARRGRLAFTPTAVTIGVALVVGTLVLTDARRTRVAAGAGLVAAGAAGTVASLLSPAGTTVLSGLGALATMVGVMALGPALAPPLCRLVAAPLPRLAGYAARLARHNVLGDPRRSAATMGALAVGLVLAAGTGVLGSSASRSVSVGIQAGSNADLYLEGSLPLATVARLAALPEVDAALPVSSAHVRIGGARVGVDGVDPAAAARILDFGLRAGSLQALDRSGGGLLVSARLAGGHGWRIGSLVPVGFSEAGVTRQLRVVGVFARDPLFGNDLVLPIELLNRYFPLGRGQADQTLLRAAPGATPAGLAAAVRRALASHPDVVVTDPAAYRRERAGDLGDLGGALGLLSALVLLAAGIATLGIANTLALAVAERTREFGLLRAVGMTARQLGAMIRWESMIVAVAGALFGTTVGIGLGSAVAHAVTVQQAGVATVTLPAGQLLVDLVLAGSAGLLAAAFPARRAARLDLRTAIGVE